MVTDGQCSEVAQERILVQALGIFPLPKNSGSSLPPQPIYNDKPYQNHYQMTTEGNPKPLV
jgi:hypothetical protein